MRKAIILTLVVFSARCFISCCKESGYRFRWTTLRLSNIHQPPLTNGSPEFLSADSARVTAYAFRMNMAHEQTAKQSFAEFGLSQAYAFKCVAVYTPVDSITSLNIITRNALDAAHPAGSSINNVVQGRPSYAFYTKLEHSAWQPLSVVLLEMNYEVQDSRVEGDFDFRINNVTPFPGQHRFVMTAVLNNGNVMTDSTDIKFY